MICLCSCLDYLNRSDPTKRLLTSLLFVSFLFGCSNHDAGVDSAMSMRNKILSSNGCSFLAEITADYGDNTQTFTLSCEADAQGNLKFAVVLPETISGISGTIDETGGKIKFDEAMLGFPLLADGQLSPVSAPWVLIRSLRSGYIVACGADESLFRATIHDSYSDDALQLEVWFDRNLAPVRGEIIYDGRRILTVTVSNFIFV